MISLLSRLHKKREEGAGIIVAILVMIILFTVVLGMMYMSVRSLEKGTSIQNLNGASNAADTAVSNMFSTVNGVKNQLGKEMDKHLGINNAVYGTFQANEIDSKTGDGKYSWRWYAEKDQNQSLGTTYNIYATGYRESPDEPEARNLKVVISSTTAEKVEYNSEQKVTYIATRGGSFAWAGLGTRNVETGKNSKVYTYNSNINIGYPNSAANNSFGKLATNGSMKLGDGTVAELDFMGINATDGINSTICSGSSCEQNSQNTYSYMISLEDSRTTALSKCPASGSYPDWVASQNGGEISYGTTEKCYNNIIFDQDTSLSPMYSTGNPAVMYARGSITVKPGVEVARQVRSPQGPYALQIVASGSTKFTMERKTLADPTKFTGTIVGTGLECDIGGTSSSTTQHGTAFYGSLACNTLKLQPESQIWWDNQLEKVLKEGSPTAKRIWAAVSYEEI